MKILFLQNLGINESLALTELSAILKESGHICDILIERNELRFISKIKEFAPSLLLIPWDIGTRYWIEKLIKKLDDNHIDSKKVFCGTFPSFYPDRALNQAGVDCIITGEVEMALIEYISSGMTRKDIDNMSFYNNGDVIKNPMRALISDLDSFPLPDRELYFKYGYLRNMTMKRFTSGKGCANSCRFCYNPLFRKRLHGKGDYVRKKSIKRLLEEIKAVRKSAALKSIHFSDDIFLENRDWTEEFCRAYPREITIPFTCNSTAEFIDHETVANLKNAGCRGIAVGIESGDEEYRRFILNKDFSNDDIKKAASHIKENGLLLTTFNMIAMPGQKIDDVYSTIELNSAIRADHVRLSFAAPLPGTELASYGLKKGLYSAAQIDKLMDNTIYPKSPMIDSDESPVFENLFHVFRFAVKWPALIPLIKKLDKNRILRIMSIPNIILNSLGERRFFAIKWLPGIIYMLKAGTIRSRTKVFNNFMP